MMDLLKSIFYLLTLSAIGSLVFAEERIPFYEDFLKESDLKGFIEEAESFLQESPDAMEAPRVAMDLLMVGKAANQPKVVDQATDFLLFRVPKSLPSLQFISSFDQGSPRMINLLKIKADQGDLGSKDFAVSYCRTLLFVAKIHGPTLLKDASLRIRAYLLATLAEVDEIELSSEASLKALSEKDDSLGKTLRIILSEKDLFSKIEGLSEISGKDAKFCLSFYLAQLEPDQANSDKMLGFRINQILFGQNPDTNLARELMTALPKDVQQKPSFRSLLAFSHHLDNNTPTAIEVLKDWTKSSDSKSEWAKTLSAYADGLSFLENRKKLFVSSIGKAIDQIDSESTCLLLFAEWDHHAKEGTNQIFVAIDKSENKFEIQHRRKKKLIMGYSSTPESSEILGPDSSKIFRFKSGGALPIPRISINRDGLTGAFAYNFNLTFGSSFSEFFKAGSVLLENPYIGTEKGREVLWNYIFSNKLIWLGPAETANAGTTYPIFSLPRGKSTPRVARITFDIQGNIESAEFENFKISKIQFGNSSLMKQLPSWPEKEIEQAENFDFSMFTKMVSVFGSVIKK